MKWKNRMISSSPLVIFTLAICSGTGCEQPGPACQVGNGSFAATFTLFSGDPNNVCGQKTGDVFGLQTYYYGTLDRLDYKRPRLAIQSYDIGAAIQIGADNVPNVIDGNAQHIPYSMGDFNSAYPKADVCTVTAFSNKAELTLGEVWQPDDTADTDTADTLIQPALDLSYEWKNMNVLVSRYYIGLVFTAEMTYRDIAAGCEATYHVQAVTPAVYCGETDENGNTQANQAICSPIADPDHGRPVGSGLNSDFKIKCDPQLLLCVLSELPAAMK